MNNLSFNFYQNVYNEINLLFFTEPGLSIFASMISTALKVKNPYVIHAAHGVLDFMEGQHFQCQHPLDGKEITTGWSIRFKE